MGEYSLSYGYITIVMISAETALINIAHVWKTLFFNGRGYNNRKNCASIPNRATFQ